MKLAAIFSLIIAIVYIVLLSLVPAFYMHLYPDVFVFYDRASFFWENFNLTSLGHNEYQPGALILFILLSPVFLIDQSLETFKWALFSANIIFILLSAFILHKWGKTSGVIVFSIMVVFLGPILLFRFDLLTVLLIILSFYLWEKNKAPLAMATMAFATIAKVYPLIFIPYLLFLSFKKDKKFTFLYYLFIYVSCFLIYLFSYTLIFQINLVDTYTSYNFHNLKSVGTESIWATVVFVWQQIQTGTLPGIESAYGINAIARDELILPIWFFNYFWVIPLGILNIWYFLKNKEYHNIDFKFCLLILLVFLMFSKVLSNQYLAWFLLLIPLINIKDLLKRPWIINMFLLIISIILHSFIFPLNYTTWLEIFTLNKFDPFLFYIGIVSNLLLILVLFRLGYEVFGRKNH